MIILESWKKTRQYCVTYRITVLESQPTTRVPTPNVHTRRKNFRKIHRHIIALAKDSSRRFRRCGSAFQLQFLVFFSVELQNEHVLAGYKLGAGTPRIAFTNEHSLEIPAHVAKSLVQFDDTN